VQRHRDLVYVETDLPEVAAQKRRALERMGSLGERHRVAEVDVLRDEDLMAVAGELDRSRPLAVITEGLLTYLPWDSVDGMWRGLSRLLSGFAAGRYISDIHLRSMQTVQRRAFRVLLAAFVRGKVYVHFDHTDDVKEALTAAGFTGAEVIAAGSLLGSAAQRGSRTNILEASTK
jgi:O-methyltransferase involved in polyketide biosynthesis